ncbi:hypothetical protein [Streptomyces niveus]|uniref:hypothetical protein n=1 Tax=Streptomyces niveus TaxID=193462 RepID=UPI00344A36EA
MTLPQPGSPVDINQLVEMLNSARDSIAYNADNHYYDRHHTERSNLDGEFDDLIDWVRAHQAEAELAKLVKNASDPDLKPGDLVVFNGNPATVREIHFHAPRTHSSGLPQHQAATEIVTSYGSLWFALTPQV